MGWWEAAAAAASAIDGQRWIDSERIFYKNINHSDVSRIDSYPVRSWSSYEWVHVATTTNHSTFSEDEAASLKRWIDDFFRNKGWPEGVEFYHIINGGREIQFKLTNVR